MEYVKKFISIFRSKAVRDVIGWSKCVHGMLALICVLNVLLSLGSLGVTLATKGLVDGVVSHGVDALWRYGALLAALILALALLDTLLSAIEIRASSRLQRSLQKMFSSALMAKDYASIKGYHSGELVNRFFSDLHIIKNGVMNILPRLFSSIISLIGASAILVAMDWRFVILLFIGGVVGLALVTLFRAPMKKRHKRRREAEEALHVSIQEALENIRLIKAGLSEKRILFKIGVRQEELEREQIRQGRFSILMNRGLGMVYDMSWLICMIWGCWRILNGDLTYGSLAAMIQLIERIEGPIMGAFKLAGDVYGVVSSAERIQELTGLPEETEEEALSDFDGIKLENVSFRYNDGTEDVLRDVNCVIHRGDFTAVTGISGGGKTSLFHLLLGIYRPTAGQVLFLSGEKAVPASRGTRQLFAYVPQGNTLFSGTLKDNLLLFTDGATDAEIDEAVQCACIDDLIRKIGLEAVLGERGVGLSEGQAQRVAIARALLSKAPVLLLDESTSALDEETEAKLLKNISALRSKTCLIVTHRKAALSICGHRLHIAEGKMTQEDKACSTALPI